MDDNRIVRSYLRLSLAEGVGPILFDRLVRAFGEIEAVPADRPTALRRVEGIGEKTAAAIAAVTDRQIDDELAEVERQKACILCRQDERYPASLRNLEGSPPVLYARGTLVQADAVSFAVVGSRRCTQYGLEQAERFGQLLGRAGMTVVSGGARGIDSAAHRGALAAGGRTVAVMGCGLCYTYPPENRRLFDQIVGEGRGALLSELPMRTAVLPGNFPTRNRIISGMSLGVLIVEAARRSGSLITARQAAEQGKTVFAVPGRVDSPLSSGANDLIRNGAILVQDLDDILEHMGEVGKTLFDAAEPPSSEPPAGGNAAEQALIDALVQGERGLDELVRQTGLDSAGATAAMTLLVLKGIVAQRPGNIFAMKRTTPKPPRL